MSSGKGIVFGVDLTSLFGQLINDIDLDDESDKLINKMKDSKDNVVYEYSPKRGFEQVNINEQKWFKL